MASSHTFDQTQFLQLAGEAMLVFAQLKGAIYDMTTIEQMGFMQHGVRPNPFDRGALLNLKQFFHMAGPRQIDYMTKFDGPTYGFEEMVV